MFAHLTADCLDRWMKDPDDFRYDFLQHCYLISKPVGYYFGFDQESLRIAHASWVAQCELWHKTYLMPDTQTLSHLKILAILLDQLASIEWVTEVTEFDPENDQLEFSGTPDEREEIRKDINAGRGTYLAFQFVMHVINWIETVRVDQQGPFVFRLTPDLEHDMMVYLMSERRDAMAVFLMLKALYVRHRKAP